MLFSVLFTYIFIEKLLATFLCFLRVFSKYCGIPDTEFDPSGNSNFSFHVGVGLLNLLFLYDFFIFFHV